MSTLEALQQDSAEVQTLVDAAVLSFRGVAPLEYNTPLLLHPDKIRELTKALRAWKDTDALVKVSPCFF